MIPPGSSEESSASFPPAASLYIHVPFCLRRCGYCAFASSVHDEAAAGRYLAALEREFAGRAAGRRFLTAYVGGGTPTVLSGANFARLLRLLGNVKIDTTPALWRDQEDFDLAAPPGPPAGVEFGCEANPGTVDEGKLRALRGAGVNRLSIGAQSFSPAGLAALGRAHDAEAARRAYAAARAAGFVNINLDLIHGWPGQGLDDWRRDLEEAVRLAPEHVSCYALSVEPGTPLAGAVESGRAAPPDEETLRQGWDLAGEVLEAAGWARYEISNFARPGFETRHHIQYWTGGDYAGIGAAAHSHEAGRRFANTGSVAAYSAALLSDESEAFGADDGAAGRSPAEDFSERLAPEAKAREALVTWLRLRGGVPAAGLARRAGFSWRELAAGVLPRLRASGGVEVDGDRLRLTREAWPVADAVLAELV